MKKETSGFQSVSSLVLKAQDVQRTTPKRHQVVNEHIKRANVPSLM